MEDSVNHPRHYTIGRIECIDYLKDSMSHSAYEGFLEGNAKKYLHRYRVKYNPIEDLKKAQWYLNKLIEHEEEKQSAETLARHSVDANYADDRSG
jgi:hypothetical protein